jgi:hypothetical protein
MNIFLYSFTSYKALENEFSCAKKDFIQDTGRREIPYDRSITEKKISRIFQITVGQ